MPAPTHRLDRFRRHLDTPYGPASCIDTGGPGRTIVFVHGLLTSSYLWRNVVERLEQRYRCVALDLPLHGQTPGAAGQDYSLPGLARFVADCCDSLQLGPIDLVANDSGGAIAQVFTARRPERLRTLTLTNCEAHDNVPPPGLRAAHLLARVEQATGVGVLARLGPRMGKTPAARRRLYRFGYEDPAHLPDDIARAWVEPLFHRREAARQYVRMFASIRSADLLAVEPALRQLTVPTLIVWGTGDRFFPRRWAYWLRNTIPGADTVVELDGARLLFPDERAGELAEALGHHWEAHNGATPIPS